MKIRLCFFVLMITFVFSGCTVDKATIYKSNRTHLNRVIDSTPYAERDLSFFNKAIKQNPKNHVALFHRAKIYKQQKKYELALADYTKAIEIEPFPSYYRDRGFVYYIKKQYDLSIREFIKALKLNNSYAAAYNDLAWLLATCDDKKFRDGIKAVEFAKKAVNYKPKAAEVNTLAAAYAEAGDFDMAVKTQEKAIQLIVKQTGNLPDGYQKRLESYNRKIPWTVTDL